MRRLWYRDSYGGWHRDRQAERGPGGRASPLRAVMIALMVLAVLVVLGSALSHAAAPHP